LKIPRAVTKAAETRQGRQISPGREARFDHDEGTLIVPLLCSVRLKVLNQKQVIRLPSTKLPSPQRFEPTTPSGHGVVPEARASVSKSPQCGDYPRPVFLSQLLG
jgi:hypothetical protein